MHARKAFVALSLACAIVFCVIATGSASADFTTAGECVKGGTEDFADAHCDTSKVGGDFGHVLFANGEKVDITAVNDLTGTTRNFTFEGIILGAIIVVECTGVSATSTVTNNAGGAVTWGAFSAKFTGCTSQKPEFAGCKGAAATVADIAATPTGPHNLGLSGAADLKTGPTKEKIEYHKEGAGTLMGLKLIPSGANFTTLTLSPACGFGIGQLPIKGSIFATPGRGGAAKSSGATVEFTKSSTIGGLTLGGNLVTLEGTLTFRKKGGEPLILTTTE